jgi:hypothetical protein
MPEIVFMTKSRPFDEKIALAFAVAGAKSANPVVKNSLNFVYWFTINKDWRGRWCFLKPQRRCAKAIRGRLDGPWTKIVSGPAHK